MYYGGHFDTSYSKFIEYEIDYYNFCDVDKMSVFEVGAIVSKSVGRKTVGATLYFKSSKEGMEKLGELENDSDIIIMTSLISEEAQFVEVFAVLVEPIVIM